MAKSDYISRNDNDYAVQMQTFKNNISGYATLLGASPAQVTGQAADADYIVYAVACQQAMSNGSQQWTGWKNITRYGGVVPPTGTPILVEGRRTRTLGRVSMDMICVDLTPLQLSGVHAGFGSEVTLWGRASNGAVLPIDEVAHTAGTVGYELMCALAARVPTSAD